MSLSPDNTGETASIDRRGFLATGMRAGVALLIGTRGGRPFVHAVRSSAVHFAPNQWLAIDEDGIVTVKAHKSEMGQGVRTSLPAIVIAELGATWEQLHVVHAEPGPQFTDMGTSGSGSIEDSWRMLRLAAATARTLLVTAAAHRWGVDEAECTARGGRIVHAASKRTLGLGTLVADAAALAIPSNVTLRPDSELQLLGSRLKRVDTPKIVVGAATYGIDVRRPGMRFAALARPPVAGARVAGMSEGSARGVPGVLDVRATSRGVAVIATNSWAAIRGRAALDVRWEDDQRPELSSTALVAALERELSSGKLARKEGDFAAAVRGAQRTIEATYTMPYQAHAAIEPLTCVADVRADRCEIWVGTQRPNGVQKLAAQMLGVPESQVIVHIVLVGGAFGRRIATDHAAEAIELSRLIEAPVQVLWTREDDFAHDFYQAPQVNRLTAAIGAKNELLAWKQQVADYHLTMFGAFNPNFDPARDEDPWGAYDSPYVFPAFEVSLAQLESPIPTGAWRSVTYPGGVFARECFVDEIAHATNWDPLALRLDLLSRTPNTPAHRNAARTAARLRNVLSLAAQRAGWSNRPTAQPPARRTARGLACTNYHGDGAAVAQVVEVSVSDARDIRVERVITAIDVGRVIDRSGLEAQVEGGVGWALSAALHTQLTIENGRAQQTNFDRFPVLRMRDAPRQEIIVVESDLPPFGAGEPPVPAVYAALGNAVFAATGIRVRKTPITLDQANVPDSNSREGI
jgi:CO/xanthine dehydrogenase Mo-binding subunit